MESSLESAISHLQERLRAHEEKVRQTKRLINELSVDAGREAPYASVEDEGASLVIHADTFYGQPLASSLRKILEMRKASGYGPASIRELHDSLVRGGFTFHARTEKNAIDGLRISLGKMNRAFHRLPTGQYGLTEWYPMVKARGPEERDGTAGRSTTRRRRRRRALPDAIKDEGGDT